MDFEKKISRKTVVAGIGVGIASLLAGGDLRNLLQKNIAEAATEFTLPSASFVSVDGYTDLFVQRAIDQAHSQGGGIVLLPSGKINLSNPIIGRSNVVLMGCHDATLIYASRTFKSAIINSGELQNFSVMGIKFVGGLKNEGTFPRKGRTKTGSFDHAIRLNGSLMMQETNPLVKNIKIVDCSFFNIAELPVYARGVIDITMENTYTENCKDIGFIYCDGINFNLNRIKNSSDNGVSISRQNTNISCNNNRVDGSAFAGIWLSGWEDPAQPATSNAGPSRFECNGNIITNTGRYGIYLNDAPKSGSVTGNTIIGVQRGASDDMDDFAGVGISVGFYPSSAVSPSKYAARLKISNNHIEEAWRGGIQINGARGVSVTGNDIYNIGTVNLSRANIAVNAADPLHNFGIRVEPNCKGIVVTNNNVFDDREVKVTYNALSLSDGVAVNKDNNLIKI